MKWFSSCHPGFLAGKSQTKSKRTVMSQPDGYEARILLSERKHKQSVSPSTRSVAPYVSDVVNIPPGAPPRMKRRSCIGCYSLPKNPCHPIRMAGLFQ
jgi:hypothetical protein